MRARHARQIRRGLYLARLEAHDLKSRLLALINESALTGRAYSRALERFFPSPRPPRLPMVPGPSSLESGRESGRG